MTTVVIVRTTGAKARVEVQDRVYEPGVGELEHLRGGKHYQHVEPGSTAEFHLPSYAATITDDGHQIDVLQTRHLSIVEVKADDELPLPKV